MKPPTKGIKPTRQQKDYDCGLACLEMYLDVPYRDIIWAARDHFPKMPPSKRGFTMKHLIELAQRLSKPLSPIYKGKGYLIGETGVLGLLGGPQLSWAGHWVVLTNGLIIIDPDDVRSVWGLSDYLERWNCRTGCLLVKREK